MSGVINLRALDALRGLLAAYVLAGHARWLLWTGHQTWLAASPAVWELPLGYASTLLRFGREAVMVFFVLSGFFIHLRPAGQMASGLREPFSMTGFYKRRWHRLGVPFLVALALTFALDFVGRSSFPRLYLGQTGDDLLDINFARKGYSVASVLPALFLLPSACGQDFGSNGPLWSLAYEVVYYAIYPFWLRVRRWDGRAAVLFGLAALGLSFWDALPAFVRGVSLHYPIWLAGAFVAELATRRDGVPQRLSWVLLIAPVLILPTSLHLASTLAVIIGLVGGVGMVMGFAALPTRFTESRFGRLAEFFGIRSYTIYICHFPILVLLSAWEIQTSGVRPVSGWFALGGTVLALAGCVGLFHLVERNHVHARLPLPQAA